MKGLRVFLLLIVVLLLVLLLRKPAAPPPLPHAATTSSYHAATNSWVLPAAASIPSGDTGALVRYGRQLMAQTALYLGPKGTVKAISNGMNCQNCHMDAGTRLFGNCFSAVAATYPRYRPRSGVVESIEFRINDCLQRSLNGTTLDSNSREMRAMVYYLKWLGKDVPKDKKPLGAGVAALPFLPRAANPEKGRNVYTQLCQQCHGAAGQGLWTADSSAYVYPPLWGAGSYNTGAGLYRLSHFAAFVKANMPFGATHAQPTLTNEQAWDVAAFVNSQPRPHKTFTSDWPDKTRKPVDYPFGPYADTFSETQHKYGPFHPIAQTQKKE